MAGEGPTISRRRKKRKHPIEKRKMNNKEGKKKNRKDQISNPTRTR